MNKKVFIFVSFLFFLIDCTDIYYSHTNLDKNLYFVFSTYRHGARTTFIKVDHFGNQVKNLGELTKYGGIQHLEIGQNYRKRYSNFLNLNYDKKEMYIRSSDVPRTIISTEKELEGLFNKTIPRSDIQIVKQGVNFWNLFQLDPNEQKEMNNYSGYCKKKKRSLGPDYNAIFKSNIFPTLKSCYNMASMPNINGFCDSVYTAYFEYTYGNDTNNKIGKCGNENPKKFHDFCYEYFNTFTGWDEYAGYMFYMLYQHIFTYMDNAINKKSPLKMFMIGGHDITVDKFMNFLNGMNIIPRTHYPHYACNIVIELRKYNNDFYLEFYYNDILKYNNTYAAFKNILDKSKFSNLYNFCGLPPWKNIVVNNTKNDTVKPVINETKNNVNEKNDTQKEIKNNNTQSEINKNETIKNNKNETVIVQKEIAKNESINKLDDNNNKNESNNKLLNNQKYVPSNEGSQVALKMKLKKFFRQEDDFNLYIILICIFTTIIVIIIAVIVIICILKKRKKEYMRFIEEQKSGRNQNINLSVISVSSKDGK